MRKAQSATEFVVLVSFMLIVFFIFFFVIQNKIIDMSIEQDKQYLREANNVVKSELDLAQQSLTDYTRTFTLRSFTNQDYKIKILDKQEIVVSYEQLEYVRFLPYNVSGYLNNITSTQTNTIYKTDGIITFPNKTVQTYPEYNMLSLNINPETCYISHKNNTNCPNLDINIKEDCQTYFGLCQ